MPTYTVTNSNFNISSKQQKKLAEGITKAVWKTVHETEEALSNSYANVVSILQPIRDMSSLLNSSSAVVCSSLNRLQIARELAKAYDSFHSINAAHADSAQKAVYAKTNPKACWDALMLKLDGTTLQKTALSLILNFFKNKTFDLILL